MHLGFQIQFLKRKCTNIAKIIAKFLKYGVNDLGLASAGKVGLGPFWTLDQVLSYEHVLQLFVSAFVSSFWHERTSTVTKIYTKMHMQDF
jgi:hypothetical protein